jgi:AcrR family transcriptional regulator
MNIRDERRKAAISLMAGHLLQEGLPGASLRSLAGAAGTSDRMLLYYFKDKDELLTATLQHIASELGDALDKALPLTPARPADVLLQEVWAVIISPTLAPYMSLWIELAAGAARRMEPHRTVAGLITDGFLVWIESRLDKQQPDTKQVAATLLTALEGLLLLHAVGRDNLAGKAITAFAEGLA